jgi:hypothetical protein
MPVAAFIVAPAFRLVPAFVARFVAALLALLLLLQAVSAAMAAAVSVIRVFILGPSQLSSGATANRERNGSQC